MLVWLGWGWGLRVGMGGGEGFWSKVGPEIWTLGWVVAVRVRKGLGG